MKVGLPPAVILAVAALLAPQSAAADVKPPAECHASGGIIDCSTATGNNASSHGGAEASLSLGPLTQLERRFAPTCSGNTVESTDALCAPALSGCTNPQQIRFWEWRRVVTLATGAATPWERVIAPPFQCLGAGAAALNPLVAIDGLVQRDFKTLVVLRGSTRVEPSPQTLVNLATTFTTDAPASYEIRTTILGRGVTITAKAQQYRWFFGDADAATGRPSVSHVYAKAGGVAPYVVIVWGGTFTIAGDPTVRQVLGTATTTGPGTPIRVREVRSQYEAG